MTFSDFIKHQMDFHRWTEKDLSRFAQLETQELSVLLKGEKVPSPRAQSNLSKALGLSTELLKSLR